LVSPVKHPMKSSCNYSATTPFSPISEPDGDFAFLTYVYVRSGSQNHLLNIIKQRKNSLKAVFSLGWNHVCYWKRRTQVKGGRTCYY
jgi:hypothetical protein